MWAVRLALQSVQGRVNKSVQDRAMKSGRERACELLVQGLEQEGGLHSGGG